jgi:hypothetical protein
MLCPLKTVLVFIFLSESVSEFVASLASPFEFGLSLGELGTQQEDGDQSNPKAEESETSHRELTFPWSFG